MKSCRVFSLALVAALSASPVVFAQPAPATGDAASRDGARQLAMEGVAAHQRADWAAVIDRFERAEQLFHAPVHLRYLAIAYERIVPARIIQSIETWKRLSEEQLPPDASPVARGAVEEARRELARLDSRIGHLLIEVPASVQGATVEVDGQPYSSQWLGTVRFVDAGEHRIVTRFVSGAPFERTINISPGATERVQVVAPVVEAPRIEAPPPPQTTTVLRPNPLRMVGIVTAGVGGAVLIGGVVTGLMANSQFSQLETDCPNRTCPSQATLDNRNSVDSLATTSTVLFVSSGMLIAAGAALFFIGKPREETVSVSVGPRSLGMSFRF
jgi:hypothetical protein